MRIGLFGASSLIAQDLSIALEAVGCEVIGFSSRSTSENSFRQYSDFGKLEDLEVVINLIGGHKKNHPVSDFKTIAVLDNLACEWSVSRNRPYIFLSSGAVFGPHRTAAVTSDQTPTFRRDFDSYAREKYRSEQKHAALRSHGGRVHDLRIFSYASHKFIQEGNYFLSSILHAIRTSSVFEVNGQDFVRDYIGASELTQAVLACIDSCEGQVSNLFSGEPTTRSQILDFCSKDLGLDVELRASSVCENKIAEIYCAEPFNSLRLYSPRKSLDVVRESFLSSPVTKQ